AGRPMLELTINGLVKGGIREIAIITNYKEEKIKQLVGTGKRHGFRATFIHQERTLGTADALRSCEGWLRGESSFIVIHGDDYYSTTAITKFVRRVSRSGAQTVAAAEADDPSRFGSIEIEKGHVLSIREKVTSKGPGQVNAALYCIGSSIFKILRNLKRSSRGEYELTSAINQSIRHGERLWAFPLGKTDWQGVTYPWDLLSANQLELQTIIESRANVRVEDGVSIAKPVIIGRGTVIKSNSYLEGPAVIGEDCVIGPNSYIRPLTSIG